MSFIYLMLQLSRVLSLLRSNHHLTRFHHGLLISWLTLFRDYGFHQQHA